MFNPIETPIQIGGHMVVTEYDADIQMDCKTIGQFMPRTNTIKIAPSIPDIQKTQTWLHEVNEAINVIWLNDDMEHDCIEGHTQVYLQILPQLGLEIIWT